MEYSYLEYVFFSSIGVLSKKNSIYLGVGYE